jgi:ubiquinone biosynthesis protein UbiJ
MNKTRIRLGTADTPRAAPAFYESLDQMEKGVAELREEVGLLIERIRPFCGVITESGATAPPVAAHGQCSANVSRLNETINALTVIRSDVRAVLDNLDL